MLQQTPVARVLPVYDAWLDRWPTPAALAADAAGEAVRMWGKLGYPRRALRLHECARVLVADHDGDGADRRADPAAPARNRRVHGAGDRGVRLRATGAGRRHQRAPGARAGRAGSGPGRAALDPARPGRDRGAAARRTRPRGPIQRGLDGTRRAGLHRPRILSARRARSPRQCAWYQAGRPGLRRPGRQAAGASPAPTARCAAGCSTCCEARPARCCAPTSTSAGPSPSSADGRWPACSTTAW